MGRKKTSEAAEETSTPAPAKKGKGKGNLLPAIVLAVGLLGGGYFMSGGGGAKATVAGAETAATEGGATGEGGAAKAEVPKGEVVQLDSITLNLADGRFVKLGLALQLDEKVKVGGEGGGEFKSARALDLAISSLGDRTYAELAAPGGRDKAKEELGKKIVEAYPEEVTGIYFTEFVMQ